MEELLYVILIKDTNGKIIYEQLYNMKTKNSS